MHILSTDRALILIFVLETDMCLKSIDMNAHGTHIAVPILFSSPHTTNPTFLAMKRLLLQPHPQIALVAMIFRKLRDST
jgi:hypothetical protein